MTSSKDWKSRYHFKSFIVGGCYLPENVRTTTGHDSTGKSQYTISGELVTEKGWFVEEDQDQWPEPPHVAFANLRVEDPQSAEAFVKRYGLLHGTGKSHLDFVDRAISHNEPVRRTFTIHRSSLDEVQLILRAAWEGDPLSIDGLEFQIEEETKVDIRISAGSVQLRTEDLYTFIAFLFLIDYSEGRLLICENPDCPAPYFRRNRKTQKFCEAGPCVAYAQRKYALDSWNRVGKNRREQLKNQAKGKRKPKK